MGVAIKRSNDSAQLKVKNGDHPPNVVIREERPGFTLGGNVLRFSEVILSK